MTVVQELPKSLKLSSGSHRSLEQGACLLEAAAFVAGEPWSDHPACVANVLGEFGRNLNDVLPDDLRQRLVPFIPRLIGTAGNPVLDERRGYMALDWLIRVYTPTWLRLVPALVPDADAIAGMRPIEDLESAAAVGDMVRAAASRADAAWAAAGAAARDAGAAARDAARDAGAAAWAAARDAAWDAAGDAAGAAAWAAAWAAAGAAAGAALAPTVTELQESAIDLFDRLIAVSA